jgi:hypothetical protein
MAPGNEGENMPCPNLAITNHIVDVQSLYPLERVVSEDYKNTDQDELTSDKAYNGCYRYS